MKQLFNDKVMNSKQFFATISVISIELLQYNVYRDGMFANTSFAAKTPLIVISIVNSLSPSGNNVNIETLKQLRSNAKESYH
jgi:hypothetical protein